MDLGLTGRRAIVCASSEGLGYACARSLAREGCTVLLNGRRAATLDAAAARLREETGAEVLGVVADVSTAEGRAAVLAALPDPDILVTNAGGPPQKDFRELTEADWEGAIASNMMAGIHMIRAVVEGMTERGFGRIVNITSMTSVKPAHHLDLSNAARLGLAGYVAGVSRQVAGRNVTINNLLPGAFATARIVKLGAAVDRLNAEIPAGRVGDPEEFGEACAFLCSAQAGYFVGQNLLIDGGLCYNTL